MFELARKDNDYILYRQTNGSLLLAVSDAAGIFEIQHILSSGEQYSFESHGEQMLSNLAQKIRDEATQQ